MSVFAHWNHYELVSFWVYHPTWQLQPWAKHEWDNTAVPLPPGPSTASTSSGVKAWSNMARLLSSAPRHGTWDGSPSAGHVAGHVGRCTMMIYDVRIDVLYSLCCYKHFRTHKHRVYRVQTCSKLFKRVMFNPSGYDLRHASRLQGQGTRSSEYSFNSSSTRSWASKNRPRFVAIEPRYQRIDTIFGEDPFSRIYHIIIYIYIYGGCPKYLFPDSPQSLSQSRSNRGTTVSNRGRGLFFVDQIIYIKYKLYYIRNRDKNLMPILCNIIVFLLNLKQLLLLLLLLVLLVLLWVFRTVSGPHKLILLPNLKSNAFTHGSLLLTLDLLLLLVLPPHPLLLHHYHQYT